MILKKKQIRVNASANVFKVFHKASKNIMVLKYIGILKFNKLECQNLKNEIILHSQLNHENIITFHDSLQIKNFVFLMTEYAENGSLNSQIRSKKKLPQGIALNYFYQIVKGVEYLHQQNIIHRDLKPQNILVTKSYQIKLCDFGLSCTMDQQHRQKYFFCFIGLIV